MAATVGEYKRQMNASNSHRSMSKRLSSTLEDDEQDLFPAANTPLLEHESALFNPTRSYAIAPLLPPPSERSSHLIDGLKRAAQRWLSDLFESKMRRIIVGDSDDRTPADTKHFPYRSIALLIGRSASDTVRSYGTGFFISETCLITAGHCVFDGGEWMHHIEVIPGAGGTDSAPFGKAVATTFRSVNGWVRDGKRLYDYGAVILDDDSLFRNVGARFGFDPDQVPSGSVEVAGYPEDRDYRPVKAAGAITGSDDFLFDHTADTEVGMSGAPVYDPATYEVRGVHTYGDGPADRNRAVKLRPSVAKMWNDWSRIRNTTNPLLS